MLVKNGRLERVYIRSQQKKQSGDIMEQKNRCVSVLLAAFALALTVGGIANASPITYDFTVTATSGPLSGTIEHGTFSYDSSSIVPGGINQAAGLLTGLSFVWNGISYDQTTANTGDLRFDASGHLTEALFGTDCSAGGNCQLVDGDNS